MFNDCSFHEELNGVSSESLRQIYFKEDGNSKLIHSNNDYDMYLMIKRFIESEEWDHYKAAFIFFLQTRLKLDRGSILNSMTVKIDYNDLEQRRLISTSKPIFYRTLKFFVDKGVLLKYKRGVYIVDPYYISVLSHDMTAYLAGMKHQVLSERSGSKLLDIAQDPASPINAYKPKAKSKTMVPETE